jgi:hypothetical protein
VIVAHILGMPVEESVVQLAPAGAATATLIVIVGGAELRRLLARLRR